MSHQQGIYKLTENVRNKTEAKLYGFSFLSGALTSVVMIMLSLRFYVSMKYLYFIFFCTFGVVPFLKRLILNKGSGKISLLRNLLTFGGQTAMFILGGAAAFYRLTAVYPPNVN